MSKQIFLPKKLKVGFQERNSTYTGKLAYVIYYDQKGKLRKELSWNNWIDDGSKKERSIKITIGDDWKWGYESIEKPELFPIEIENEPTEGFVLNKKVGGHSYGWNNRQTYCRVYDPRGFEFEITMENLLYILDNTNSIVGKGLEGEFIYGWEGKELVLIPTCSPDYKELQNYTSLQSQKLSTKDLVVGCIYETKKQDKYVYLGRFNYHSYDWRNDEKKVVKRHWFSDIEENRFYQPSSMTSFARKVTDEPVENISFLLDEMEHSKSFSPLDEEKHKYIRLSEYKYDSYIKIDGKYVRVTNRYNYYKKNEEKDDRYLVKIYSTYKNDYSYDIVNKLHDTYEVIQKFENKTLNEVYESYEFFEKILYLENNKTYKYG